MKFEIWIEETEGIDEITVMEKGGVKREYEIGENARLVHCFEAFSYFEQMTKYYKYMDWGEYKSYYDGDKELFKE